MAEKNKKEKNSLRKFTPLLQKRAFGKYAWTGPVLFFFHKRKVLLLLKKNPTNKQTKNKKPKALH